MIPCTNIKCAHREESQTSAKLPKRRQTGTRKSALRLSALHPKEKGAS